jgi:RNA polymerase sigma-70 factor, ECF subfamily
MQRQLAERRTRIFMATAPLTKLETQRKQPQSHGRHERLSPDACPTLYHRLFQARRTVETYPFNQEYVDRLSQSDTETATHFIRYFTKLLLAKLRAKMSSANQAEDVAQETLYRVLVYVKKHGGIEHPDRLGAFVNAVSEHVLLEVFRQGCRFQQVPENVPEPVERALDAEINCINSESKEMIRRELKKLKKSDQDLLEKVYLLERDKDEICAEMKIDRNYLRVQVHRALERFRKVLGPGAKKAAAN